MSSRFTFTKNFLSASLETSFQTPVMFSARHRRQLGTNALLAVLPVIGAACAGLLIAGAPSWSLTELQVVARVHDAQNPVLDVVASMINAVFGAGAALVALIVFAWVLLVTRSWRVVLRVGIVLAVPWSCADVLKLVVRRPRPDSSLLQPLIVPDPATYSYPSGHTAFAAALCCALLLVVARRSWGRWGIAVGLLVVITTAWSRVYLGVHYPTDVLASALLVPVVAVATTRMTAAWSFLNPNVESPETGEQLGQQGGR